jgi:hypothetical protein
VPEAVGAGGFAPITPTRALDTRNSPPCVGTSPRTLTIGGTNGIPLNASAVSLNVTVVDPTDVGYVTVWPAGQPQPLVSNLNYLPGDVVPNMVIVELGTGGAINISSNNGCPNIIVDIGGSFAGDSTVTVPGAPTAVDGSPGDGEVLLNWTAPVSDGGSPITGYVVTPSQGGAPQTPITFPSTATTQTVTGLTDGLPYTFTVAAINTVGTGPASAASIAYTPTAACSMAPPAPLNGTPLTMAVKNSGALADDQVFLTLTGVVLNGYSSWGATPYDIVNNSIPMSCLPQDLAADPTGHTRTFQLGEGVGSGLLWISQGQPIPTGPSGLPTVQPSMDTSLYRFANVEFAYPGQGDMTNVNQFSFPVDLDTWSVPNPAPNAPTSQSSHYSGTTCDILSAMKTAVTAQGSNANWSQIKVVDGNGNFVRVVAPMQRTHQLPLNGSTPNPFAQGWPSMLGYVQSLANQTITVQGLFTPPSSSAYYGETGWYSYTGTFDGSGNITLNGNIQYPVATGFLSGGTPGMALSVKASTEDVVGSTSILDGMVTGIYDQNSLYTVGTSPSGDRNGFTNGSANPAGPNDVYNSIYRDLTTAFTYGYWGGVYGSSSAGFWQTFSPPGAPDGGQNGFTAARPAPDPVVVAGGLPYNLWSQVLFQYSNNYNIPYGENYGSGSPSRPSPLLNVPPGGRWEMTVKSDGPTGCLANY